MRMDCLYTTEVVVKACVGRLLKSIASSLGLLATPLLLAVFLVRYSF